MNESQQNKMKVYLRNKEGKLFECFADGTRKEVHDSWLSERIINDRTYKFKCMRFAEEQVNILKEMMKNKLAKETYLCSEVIEMHMRYGLITVEEYKEYQQL